MSDALLNFRTVLWAVPQVIALIAGLLVLLTIVTNRR